MDKLVHWMDLRDVDPGMVESPAIAMFKISELIRYRETMEGLDLFLAYAGFKSRDEVTYAGQRELDQLIENGTFVYLSRAPALPLISDPHERYGNVASFLFRSSDKYKPKPVVAAVRAGPGKWRTTSRSKNTKSTWAALAANWASYKGEDRAFMSDGKDMANTKQVVTQTWVELERHDDYLRFRSVSKPYGVIRKIEQFYWEGGDAWQISGKSWHWVPAVAHEVYEYKDGGQ